MIGRGEGLVHLIVGRERELEATARYFDAPERLPRALILAGEAGIGKTTLWRAAVHEAERRGFRTLVFRAASAEVRLSFAALADLLEDVLDDVLPRLPPPQRRALEVALLRAEGLGPAFDERVVFAATLGSIRWLAAQGPLAIAIDDLQWLDPPSAGALEFTARRLSSERVAFLATRRTGGSGPRTTGLETAFGEGRLERIEVAGLSFGALHRLLLDRAGEAFTRPMLRRIHETSAGNPFYALELSRAVEPSLPSRAVGSAGTPLALPPSLDELLGQRLVDLPRDTRTVLFLAAATSQRAVAAIDRAFGQPTRDLLAPAIEADVIQLDGDTIAFGHPLLAAAAYGGTGIDRRRWHARLAETSTDVEERARQKALATDNPDPEVAALLVTAGTNARARGAATVAAELLELAVARTPMADVVARTERAIEAARTLLHIGERRRARRVIDDALPRAPRGGLRSDLLMLLVNLVEDEPDGARRGMTLLEEAITEAGPDAHRHCEALLELESRVRWIAGFDLALDLSRQALALADQTDDVVLQTQAHTSTADLEVLTGLGGDPVRRFARAMELDTTARIDPGSGPAAMLAVCLIRAGRLAEARPLLAGARKRAIDEGDEQSRAQLAIFLAELNWLAGDWDVAEEHTREGLEVAEQSGSRVMQGAISALLALTEGVRGNLDHAVTLARDAAATGEGIGETAYATYNRQVQGFLELSRGNAALGHELLSRDPMPSGAEGTKRISFVGDEIEALIQLGRFVEAAALCQEVEVRGRLLGRRTLTAVAARCRAQLQGAGTLPGSPEVELAQALAVFEELGLPFERARTMLVLGETRRRAKQKRAAREALEAAAAGFEALGAPLWVARARQELARIGGRTLIEGLTPTERQVAELVVAGKSNKEVAAALFVSTRAVEANLTRIYAKLGVGSRTELARRL